MRKQLSDIWASALESTYDQPANHKQTKREKGWAALQSQVWHQAEGNDEPDLQPNERKTVGNIGGNFFVYL